ncbi:MAG: hypothetical protein H5T50_04775 [Nitrososphaeria archaeon]|nr:hypothetical protein [Nitrososphaeria archaeon]
MKLKKIAVISVAFSVIVLPTFVFLGYTGFSPTISTSPITVNAYWLKTNIILGESTLFVVKAANSDFVVQIWKEGPMNSSELIIEYEGSGFLSQNFVPRTRGTYYLKVILPDKSLWVQQEEYMLIVG